MRIVVIFKSTGMHTLARRSGAFGAINFQKISVDTPTHTILAREDITALIQTVALHHKRPLLLSVGETCLIGIRGRLISDELQPGFQDL